MASATLEAEDLTADEFYTAEDPPEDPDPQGSGALADPPEPSAAADEPPPPDPVSAPFGYTRDRGSKEWRPKLRPGRPKHPPTAEELKAGAPPEPPPADEPPREDRRAAPAAPPPSAGQDAAPAMPAKGLIARKINKAYRRAGRFISLRDPDIGAAFIMAGTKEDEDEITAGEAWEELCRTNPRVRAFVMRFIQGGTYWDLIMAHAPIFLAILMKDAVLKYIPFRALLERWAEPEETAEGAELRPEDTAAMMDLAQAQAEKMAAGLGVKVSPQMMANARAQAERQHSAQNGGGAAAPGERPPPAPGNRHQRRAAQSRAKRKAGSR